MKRFSLHSQKYMKVSLDSKGVIPAEGKNNVAQLLLLCSKIGIRCFVLFDADVNYTNDAGAHTETNKAFHALLGQTPDKRPKSKCYEVFDEVPQLEGEWLAVPVGAPLP